MNKARLVIFIVTILGLANANALTVTSGTYQFFDHPDGSITQMGAYGLRLDDLPNPAGVGPTFSVEQNGASIFMTWDGLDEAIISGQIWNNATNELWLVHQVISDITTTAIGFRADTGLMTLTDPLGNIFEYASTSNGTAAFYAEADNHRCGGHAGCGPLTARGWLMPNGVDSGGQFNDWLVQITPVPIPGAIWLFSFSLLTLVSVNKKSK